MPSATLNCMLRNITAELPRWVAVLALFVAAVVAIAAGANGAWPHYAVGAVVGAGAAMSFRLLRRR